jgi:hypothetical protein
MSGLRYRLSATDYEELPARLQRLSANAYQRAGLKGLRYRCRTCATDVGSALPTIGYRLRSYRLASGDYRLTPTSGQA